MLENIIFTSLYFLFPVIIFFSYKYFGIKVNEVSILNVSIISLFVFSYAGLLPLYFYWDDYRYKIGVVDREIITYMLVASTWSIFSIILSFGILKEFFGIPPRRFFWKGMRRFKKSEVLVCILAFLICLSSFISYVTSVDQVALIVAIVGSEQTVAAARSSMTNSFDGNYHWYRLFIGDFSVFISYCLYANYSKVKSKNSLALFLISFVLCCVFLLASAQKAPVIWYLVGLYLVSRVVNKGGFVDVKGLLALATVGLSALVILYVSFMGVDNFSLAIKSIFSRAFAAGISASYFYLQFFPEVKDFLWGASLPNPGGLLPFDPYPLTTEIMEWRFPGKSEQGVVGSSPTVFWAEAYANFSWVGVFLVPFLLGAIIYFYHFMVSFFENTPFKVALIVWLALFFRNIATTGFSSFLINVTFFSFIFLVVSMILISNNLTFKIIR